MGAAKSHLDGLAGRPGEWNGDLETPRRDVAAMVAALTRRATRCACWSTAPKPKPRRAPRSATPPKLMPAKLRRHLAARHRPDFCAPRRGRRGAALHDQQLGRQVRSARRRDGRRRHRAPRRNARPPLRFRAGRRRRRSRRRGHDPDDAADAAQPQPQRLDESRTPRRRSARRSAPGRSSGSTRA